ncbi:MAG TPA: gas vesicle protein GvpO [Micromonospora sp.]
MRGTGRDTDGERERRRGPALERRRRVRRPPEEEPDEVRDRYADTTYDHPEEREARYDRLPAAQAAREGVLHLTELTGQQVNVVVAVEPSDDGWLVGVEVVEDHRIPSSIDLLGLYEVAIDHAGDLLSYRRIRRYPRGKTKVG